MEDCDYCPESFDDEAAYLDHLADAHDGELGPIDRRRVSNRGDDDGGLPFGPVLLGVLVVFALGLAVYATQLGGGGVNADGIEAAPLNESGDAQRLSDVERFDSDGKQHVESGSTIDYAQMPPLSGPHYNRATEGGYYTGTPALGNIVHGLEHGAVVIYYTPDATSDAAEQSLREFAVTHTGNWKSVIVAPNPNDNPEADYVLTAWRHRLYINDYDARTVHAFLSEFLGRGPENPVR